MRKFNTKIFFLIAFFSLIYFFGLNDNKTDYDSIRILHKQNLEKSPFKNTKKLSKSERKELQLPPNPYNERLWELTMDPVLGRPRTENLYQIQDELYQKSLYPEEGVPGENPDMAWVARGPSNVAGRTNGIMFDPNDATNKRVFAGGVSGGIFVNDDITDVESEWRMIKGVPRNLPISELTYDPNNPKIFYAGTGESFTSGDAIGNGLWRSNDGGNSWENIFGGRSDSEEVFKNEKLQIEVLTENTNPMYFMQASFGPNLPGPPLNYLQNDIIIANPLDGCSTLTNAEQVKGKIVLIQDGTINADSNCDYYKKVSEGQKAGAAAVIVYNKNDGSTNWTDDLITMNPNNNDATAINIPSIFIKASDGEKLKEYVENKTTTVKIVKQTNLLVSGVTIVPGMFFINDVVVRNNNGTSEIYVAAGSRKWDRVLGTRSDTQNTIIGSGHDGIYKSIDGINWEKIELYYPIDENNSVHNATVVPMDLELDKDNRLWASSTISPRYGMVGGQWGEDPPRGGGKLYRLNEEGTSATFIHAIKVQRNTNNGTITYDGRRTEMAFTADNLLIVLCVAPELYEGYYRVVPRLYRGSIQDWIQGNPKELSKPNDADTGIEVYDFARGQGYYSVSLAAHPTNKDRAYVGGINLFSSNQAGDDWGQLTHQRGRYAQYIHADQHSVIFSDNNDEIMLIGNDGGIGYSSDGGNLETRNNMFHTAQYYTVAVAPVGMFDNYSTKVYGYDPLQGSWDPNADNGNGGYVRKMETIINGQSDVFAGGMQDNGTSLQADNDNGFSLGNDISGGDGAATMFSQNNNNRYVVYNYVYNNIVTVLNMNNPSNDRSYWWRIASNDDDEGDFINKGALDSNLGIIYMSADAGKVRAFHNWDDFAPGSQGTIKDTYLIENLGSSITALTVSPFETQSSTLYAGNEVGQLFKISNAQNPNNQDKEEINGNEFSGSISDIEFGVDENHIFVTMYNYGVESIFYTSDGGVTWDKKEGNLPDLPVYNILQSPLDNEEVIIGTELGVWFTNNFSSSNPSWSQANAGMKDLRVTDMDLRKGDNKVFISTYGLGIFSGIFQNTEPTFTIDSNTDSIEILTGDKKSFDVDYRVYNDFNEEVIFSIDGLPDNTVVNYSPGKKFVINSDGKLTVELEIDEDANIGSYDLKLKAVSTSKSKELEITLRVISDDNDKDGVKNDVDNCPETANADQSDIDGDGIGDVCDSNPLPKDTFSLQSSNETCRSSNDGKMKLDVKRDVLPSDTDIKFTVAVTGGPSGFTHTPELLNSDTWVKENLEAATYTVCLTSDYISNYEQCFNVIISEPQDLSVLTSQARGSNILNMTMSGSKSYTIMHNNKPIKTSESKFDLDLKKGLNIIKVYAEKECQGVYEETIFNSEDILLSPNPAKSSSKLWIGGDDKNVNVSMFDNAGRLLWTNENNVPSSRSIDIQVSNLRPGLYYIKVESETVRQTAKLIKE